MATLSLRLVGAIGARINVRSSYSQKVARHNPDLNQGSHGYKPSAFTKLFRDH